MARRPLDPIEALTGISFGLVQAQMWLDRRTIKDPPVVGSKYAYDQACEYLYNAAVTMLQVYPKVPLDEWESLRERFSSEYKRLTAIKDECGYE